MIILIPTILEARFIIGADHLPELTQTGFAEISLHGADVCVGIVGVGLAAAGSGTGYILRSSAGQNTSKARALLIGFAGSLQPGRILPGSLVVGDRVFVDGIGMGRGGAVITPLELGIPQRHPWRAVSEDEFEVEELSLPDNLKFDRIEAHRGGILSTAVSAGSPQQAGERAHRFPGVLIEEMEGYAVALACALHDVELSIVRAVSNEAGIVDRERWDMSQAGSQLNTFLAEAIRSGV